MTQRDLACWHTEGKDELLDLLSNGQLYGAQQRKLATLLSPLSDLPNFFRATDVADYETEDLGDGNYVETWTCPICGYTNREEQDA